ncbi:MAG: peptide chain release factor N(5)-glutamine methyltransferase [Desulfuromonadales bacterium]|nr:peptide chain release factor N(5)-glutamine methyltransferase [Desulfuromonadales bacterium]
MAESWTVLKVLQWTEGYFREREIAEPRLDAQVLLADQLGLDRVGLYVNFERPLSPQELAEFRQRVGRRVRHEPVQYILGRSEFWSLTLRVTPAVLIPRADTEVLVEEALARAPAAANLLDVGTGSGAIAIALAHELPAATVLAVDLSLEALAVAATNAQLNQVADRIVFQRGDLTELPAGPFDLIVSNPPYIPVGEIAALMPEVRDFEPHLALDGGADGLASVRHLARQAPSRLRPGGWLLVEIGVGQAEAAKELFLHAALAEVFARDDYAGIPRVVGGRKL